MRGAIASLFLFLLFIVVAFSYSSSHLVHAFNVHDLNAIPRVSGLAVSPNGAHAVFSVRTWDAQSGAITSNLYIMDLTSTDDGNTSSIRRLTNKTDVVDVAPIWSPDSKVVAFLSNRNGKSQQIWQIPAHAMNDSSARPLTDLPVDIDNIKWSPTGEYIAFSASVYSDCPIDSMLNCTAERNEQQVPNAGVLYTSLYVRHWDTWETPGKHNHMFVIAVSKEDEDENGNDDGAMWKTNSRPISIMYGLPLASPVPPFGGAEQYGWSPDGTEIAFTAETIANNTAWSTSYDIYISKIPSAAAVTVTSIANFNSTITPICITNDYVGRTQNPTYSPDGRYIAFLAMDRAGFEADQLKLQLYDRSTATITGKNVQLLLPSSNNNNNNNNKKELDRSIGEMVWSPDSSSMIISASDNARTKLFLVSDIAIATATATATAQVRELIGDCHNANPSFAATTSKILFMQDCATRAVDIWTFDLNVQLDTSGVQPQRLTYYFTTEDDAEMSKPIDLSFISPVYPEDKVHAFLFRAVGDAKVNDQGRYPLAVLIHGGPQSVFQDSWSYRWNYQLFTNAGYAVLAVNFHGSTGWGQNFTDTISGNWGMPYDDIMAGIEYALEQYDWLDRERIVALGASYGGYMINWINGHISTDERFKIRFKCLVNHDGVFDSVSAYFTTEELFFFEWENGGIGSTPWSHPEIYERFTPRRFVDKWQTPTMVIQGGRDYRLPESEGIATFTALQRRGVPSQFLYFPRENHWVTSPKNNIMWYNTVLAWLDQWIDKPLWTPTTPSDDDDKKPQEEAPATSRLSLVAGLVPALVIVLLAVVIGIAFLVKHITSRRDRGEAVMARLAED